MCVVKNELEFLLYTLVNPLEWIPGILGNEREWGVGEKEKGEKGMERERESIYVCGNVCMYAFMCILLKLPGIFIVKNTWG